MKRNLIFTLLEVDVMNNTVIEIKKAKNLKEWIKQLFVTNLITVIVETLIFTIIYFIVVGPMVSVIDITIPGFTSMGFMILFIPCGISTVPIGIIFGSRRDCIKGKWKIEEREISETFKNPWHRLGLEAIIIGAIITIFLWLIFWFLIPELLAPIISIIISICIVVIFTTLLLRRHLHRELVSFWSVYIKKDIKQKPFRNYFFVNLAFPWVTILLYILLILGLRSNLDSFLSEGSVDFVTLFIDMLSSGLIIAIWMWSVSKTKFGIDVKIGRVSKEGKKISKNVLIILLLLIPIVTASIMFLLNLAHSLVLEIYYISAVEAILMDILIGVLLGIFGLYLGILWGRMKEFKA